MLDRRANAGRLGPWTLLATFVVIIGLSGRAVAADWANFPPTNFKIYSEDGSQVIGNSHFVVERLPGGELRLHGENHYLNGQHDVELDTLEIDPGEAIPRLKSFSHVFYQSNGALFIAGTADIKTGEAVCVTNEEGTETRYTKQLDFPPDTYAGASILIPIMHALRHGVTAPIRMHYFDCTPEPKVLTIEATPNSASPEWQYYPGRLVEVQAKPDLGWLDLIAAPFLPTMHAWFDPAEGFSYVGGGINRYFYSKAHVTLVKVKPSEALTAPTGARAASVAPSPEMGTDGAASPGRAPSAAPQNRQAAPSDGR